MGFDLKLTKRGLESSLFTGILGPELKPVKKRRLSVIAYEMVGATDVMDNPWKVWMM
jgi:hypothetical protein